MAKPKVKVPVKPGLEKQLAEVRGDVRRLAELLANTLGDPFASAALDIVNREQGE